MAVAFDVADGGTSTGTTITTSGVSPSGSDRLMLAVAVGEGDATDVKSGGSGGTSLTQVLSDTTIFPFVIGNKGNVWEIHPGPTGSTTGYATFGSGSSSALSTIYFTGVDQTTPYTTPQTSSADGSSTPSLSMTGLSASQPVVVALMVAHLPSALSGLTPNGSTTVRRTDAGPVPGSEHQSMTLWLTGTADGSGNVTIGGTLISSPDVGAWAMWGVGLNAASGGGDPSTITAATGTASASSIAGSSTAVATATAAAGAATASTRTGSSTASTNATAAAGAATTSTLAGSAGVSATITGATGAATASTVTGSSTASAAETAAAGAATAGTLAGSSTAVASFVAAAGAATAATLSSDLGAAVISPAAGVATASSMAGASTAIASFVPASGQASTATFAGPQVEADAVTGGWYAPIYRRKRKADPPPVDLPTPEQVQAQQKDLETRRALRRAEAKDRQVVEELRRIYSEQDALSRGISQAQAAIAEQIEDEEDVALLLALAS